MAIHNYKNTEKRHGAGRFEKVGAIYCIMKGKETFLSDKWVEVSWLTLTQPNETHHKHLIRDTDGFADRLAKYTKCHTGFIWGLMGAPNTHCHIAVCVPEHEVDRYNERIKRFKPELQWTFRHFHFQPWKPNLGTYHYILEKHYPQELIVKCPKHYARCRCGQCTDIAS